MDMTLPMEQTDTEEITTLMYTVMLVNMYVDTLHVIEIHGLGMEPYNAVIKLGVCILWCCLVRQINQLE